VDTTWTLPELVAEVAARIAALPAPKNGQIRAVPDERTVRYYAALGLLDRPSAMRGRTALYGAKHAAQIVAIKRLQTMGRSLSAIQDLWSTLDDATLARMSGIAFAAEPPPAARGEFWKQPPLPSVGPAAVAAPVPPAAAPTVELRIALAPGAVLSIAVPDGIAISPDDVRALRAAAAPLLAELASRQLASPRGESP
jgi:DNA-binding transcriptional MerR regulator